MLVTQTGTGLDKLRARCRCSNAQKLWGAPGFSGTHILPSKIKKILDLKISSQIDKTMKKLKKKSKYYHENHWYLQYFDVYIFDSAKTDLST